MSWFDMRTTILGFVALSRYVFADEDLVKGKDGGARRFLYPRMFTQVRRSLLSYLLVCSSC